MRTPSLSIHGLSFSFVSTLFVFSVTLDCLFNVFFSARTRSPAVLASNGGRPCLAADATQTFPCTASQCAVQSPFVPSNAQSRISSLFDCFSYLFILNTIILDFSLSLCDLLIQYSSFDLLFSSEALVINHFFTAGQSVIDSGDNNGVNGDNSADAVPMWVWIVIGLLAVLIVVAIVVVVFLVKKSKSSFDNF